MSDPIGIIGLGLLGSAVADRLHACGHQVHGYDPRENSAAHVQHHASAGDVFAACDQIIFSLPTSDIATAVVGEVREQLRPGQVIVDTTTGDPGEMVAIAEELAKHAVHYVEANVAGSSDLLRRKQAPLFVAGDEDVTDDLAPLFADLTSNHLYLGEIGNASRFKLVHNLVLGLHRAVLAEGLQFAEALGFDPAQTLILLQQTPAASDVMATKGLRMVDRHYDQPQARVAQHLKDVRLMLAEAEGTGARMPLTTVHRKLLEAVEQQGLGEADTSAIMEAFNPSER